MGRYLLIANQTLGGEELHELIRRRIEAGPAEFHVVVPMIEPRKEAATYVAPDRRFAMPASPPPAGESTPVEEAHQRSEHRLRRMISTIEEAGGTADGEVGPTDARAAAEDALSRFRPDEVIVSTLPRGLSRWLKLDLPSRIERLVEVPVTVVEAERGRAAA
jgi:hypothetical protein